MNALKEYWDKLNHKQKKCVILLVIASVVVGFGLTMQERKVEKKSQQLSVEEQEQLAPRRIGYDDDIIQKTMLREQRIEQDRLKTELSNLKEELEKIARGGTHVVVRGPSQGDYSSLPKPDAPQRIPGEEKFWKDNDIFKLPNSTEEAEQQKQRFAEERERFGLKFPPPPSPETATNRSISGIVPGASGDLPTGKGIVKSSSVPTQTNGPTANAQQQIPPQSVQLVGGIGHLSNGIGKSKAAESKDDKKKQRSVYLPPSFMMAELINGGDISTSEQGASNPEPFFLRIQTPSILPNDVKMNLKGCFVLAEGTGRLDKERAMLRTISLSCLSRKGESIINEDIKGYVADSDSKAGLAGRVVSRNGAMLARTFVAGLLEGAGEALQTSSETTTVSSLTGASTSIVNTDELKKQAIGQGLSQSAETLKDFYLDLARQATPVIEVLSARKVTVFITQGVELKIKELANDEF